MKILIALVLLAVPLVAQIPEIPPQDRDENLELLRMEMSRFKNEVAADIADYKEYVGKDMNRRVVTINRHVNEEVREQVNAKAIRDKEIEKKLEESGESPPLDTKDYTAIAMVILGLLSSMKGGNQDG